MNKEALGAIIVTGLLVLSISSPIASAVRINYEADSDGDYICISEEYDSTVKVTEDTVINFGSNLQVDQERTVKGTGKTDLEQTITGEPREGPGYVAENYIKSGGKIDARTSTSATANTLGVDQSVSATGKTSLYLAGEKAGNKAGHGAGVGSGTLQSKQTLAIGDSVHTSLEASIKGTAGYASSGAVGADGNYASTFVNVNSGKISTMQEAKADGSATASMDLVAAGAGIKKGSYAGNAEGDYAGTSASVGKGLIVSHDEAKATKKKATASEQLVAIGAGITKGSEAGNAEGDYASTSASVKGGLIVSDDNAVAVIGKATASEQLVAIGAGIEKGSEAENAVGDKASTSASVGIGLIVSDDNAVATKKKATASEQLVAIGAGIEKGSEAENAVGDYASTSALVGIGLIVSDDKAVATKKKATASEQLVAIGARIEKGSEAGNAEGDYANTSASVGIGLIVSDDKAVAVIDKATASEQLVAIGAGIEKGSYAENAEGDYANTSASVKGGLIVSDDKAVAVIDKATASEQLVAIGAGIEKGSYAENAEGDYANTSASVKGGLIVSDDNAVAVIDKANASEQLVAIGAGIEKGSEAGNAEGDYASTRALVDRGLVVSYDEAEAVIDKANASEQLVAIGSGIEKGSHAENEEGDYANTSASVDRGLVVSYDEAEAVIDKANASELLVAIGSGIEKGSEAGNAEGDYARTHALVDRGLVVSYDEAEAVVDKANASELLVAIGAGIEKGSHAENEEGDYAGTHGWVDRGLVVSYDEAEATIDKANASELLVAIGSGIWKGSGARNAEEDYAATEASVEDGFLASYDKAKATIDKATASEALVATGSGIWKVSYARNADGDYYAVTEALVEDGFLASYDKAVATIDKATASEALVATGSGIWKVSYARNADGDYYAVTQASVEDGFLASYDKAEAIIDSTTASEALVATGSGIKKVSYARNADGDYYAVTQASVEDGFLASYDKAKATIDKATASELLVAEGSGIWKGSEARNAEEDYAVTEASVEDGFLASYDKAVATIDKATTSELLVAEGSGIWKGSGARNEEGYYAGTDAWVHSGLVVSYDNAVATIDKATTSELLVAEGSGIWKGSGARNAEGDYASTSASVEDGFLASYDKAKATIDKATTSELLVATGSGIRKGSEARNAEGYYAGTDAWVNSGLVVSYDNAVAVIDSTTVVAGSMITGDVIDTDSSVTNSRGDSSTYASVEDGILLSFLVAASTEKMTGAMQIALAEGELIKAGDISHAPNGYARNDVTVSNGDLIAGMGTTQMPLDDMKFDVGPLEVELTEIDTAVAGMLMHTDNCDSVTASAEADNGNVGGTAYDAYTGSGTVTKVPIAVMLHLHLHVDMPWPFDDIDEPIDVQLAEVIP